MSKGKKVLVVDDEPDIREILFEELKFAGLDVYEASNGQDAYQIFLKEKPQTILSDVRMSGGDGVTLARQVKSASPFATRVFLLTGFADLTPWDAYDIGVEGYYTKPFQLAELRDVVLRSFKPLEELFAEHWTGTVAGSIQTKLSSSEDFLNHPSVRLGRGGVFIPLELLKERKPFRSGEKYHLECGSENLGIVTFRWARTETGQGTGALGLGLEFVSCAPSFLQKLRDRRQFESGVAYIPSGPS